MEQKKVYNYIKKEFNFHRIGLGHQHAHLLVLWDTKQLLDEFEHDIMNYQNRGLCYLPKPKAKADNTDTRF